MDAAGFYGKAVVAPLDQQTAIRTKLLLEHDWGWAQRGTKGSGGVNCTTCVCVGASCVARRSTPTPLPPPFTPLSPYLHQGQPTAQDGRGNDQGAVVVAGQGGVGLGTTLDRNPQCQQHEQGQGVPTHTKGTPTQYTGNVLHYKDTLAEVRVRVVDNNSDQKQDAGGVNMWL